VGDPKCRTDPTRPFRMPSQPRHGEPHPHSGADFFEFRELTTGGDGQRDTPAPVEAITPILSAIIVAGPGALMKQASQMTSGAGRCSIPRYPPPE
jgi:hypothetical protein